MNKMKLLWLIFLLFTKNSNAQSNDVDSILCTATFCATYVDTNPCPKLSDNCKINNSTNNGRTLPSPDPCNCCTHCIDNLNEGDYCDKGTVGMVPDGICGPGLSCNDDGVCVKMAEAPMRQCSKDQAAYDQKRNDGTLGQLETRPECDDDGLYKPYRCIPGLTCFCVDVDGNRIFGETNDTTKAKFSNCQCSRKYEDARKFLGRAVLYPNQHFRCKDDGDYDAIQCIGDRCMCVDASDGAPTYPKDPMVNITKISEDTLACFDKDIYVEGQYYYPCAARYLEVLEELQGYKDDGYDTVFGIQFPNCDINGKYAPVQNNSEYAYCATSDGLPIEPYSNIALDELPGMDCHCARTSLLLSEDLMERPICCSNGSFKRVQCRRGTCYCVDSNGYQLGNEEVEETEQETLSCYAKACTFV